MLFKKYQVFVFDEKSGKKRSFSFKSSVFVYVFLFLLALVGVNGFFVQHFLSTKDIKKDLFFAEREIEEKESRLVGILAELEVLREDINRIRQFDNQLKMLVGEKTLAEESSVGGIEADDFKVDMLPLHRQELASRKILSYIRELKKDSQLEEIIQQDLIVYMNESTQKLASIPSIIPSQGFITSRFGYRTSPFTGSRQLHKGLDVAAPIGTKIISPADGKVVFAQRDGAYGLSVKIDHGNGIITRYAHMSKFNVKRGDRIKRGDLIGLVGNTGRSTGAHLHYEVIVNGVHTDPMAYIVEK